MFLTALLVFLIPSFVIIFVNIIRSKVFFGDIDDSINEYNSACHYNSRTSLNKLLNAKMQYYGKLNPIPMRWVVFYSNYVLPLLAIVSTYNVVKDIVSGVFVLEVHSLLYLFFSTSSLFNVLIIRGIDEFAFYFNFLPATLLILYISVPFNDLSIFNLLVFVPIIGANVFYFVRRRKLFFSSLRQLKLEFEIQNAEFN